MRLDDFRSSDNVEDRRGSGGGGGLQIGRGGIGLGGLLIVLVISYFTGINPAMLIGGYRSVTGGSQQEAEPGKTGAPTDESGSFVSKVLGSSEDPGRRSSRSRSVRATRRRGSSCSAAERFRSAAARNRRWVRSIVRTTRRSISTPRSSRRCGAASMRAPRTAPASSRRPMSSPTRSATMSRTCSASCPR